MLFPLSMDGGGTEMAGVVKDSCPPASGVVGLVAPEVVATPKPENNALQGQGQTVTNTFRLWNTHMGQRLHPFSLSWVLQWPPRPLSAGHRGRKLVGRLMGYDMKVGRKGSTVITY